MPAPEHIVHPLAPIVQADSRVLILGTMPSPRSRAAGFYYRHPQNRFWPTLAAVLDVPLPADDAARERLARTHHIALWDVLASCDIAGASDGSIRHPVANDIVGLLRGTDIRAVFTAGGAATRLYRRLAEPAAGLPAIPLPSPSPANCRLSAAELADAYRAILPYIT